MPRPLAAHCEQRILGLQARGLWRQRLPRAAARASDAQLQIFCANDYLGLANDPRLTEAWQSAAAHYGVGSGASQYVSGYSFEQQALEEELADWTGREAALVFGAGYLANPGVIDALVGRGDDIVSDALNHASLIDGCRLSGARVLRYAHRDVGDLTAQLQRCGDGNRLLLSDSIFSMDGDCAELPELVAAAQQHQAWLMLDDAHGLGVLGADGAGSLAAAGLGTEAVPILTATLGKSLGVYGAFVAGDRALIDFLVQTARSAIFTTALPPALLATARAAVRIARQEAWRREQLQLLIRQYRAGLAARSLPDSGSSTPIQPLLVGAPEPAMALSAALRERGYWVTAIRPPTVPAGTSRLRVTLSASHSAAAVDGLLDALADCWSALEL